MEIPHTSPSQEIEARPGRVAAAFRRDAEGCRVGLLGLPDDTGVGLNGGRQGAAAGPRAIRGALAGFGTVFDAVRRASLSVGVFDAGDVIPAEAGADEERVIETHQRATAAARAIGELGIVTVGLGGGHDLTRPTVRALSERVGGPVGGINVDAHLDVREAIGSGMPYRFLIDEGHLDAARFVELGIGRHTCDAAHVEYLRLRGGTIIDIETTLVGPGGAIDRAFELALPDGGEGFVSIDLDAIDASQAPGVSAPCPMGMSVATAVGIAQRAGRHPGVGHFDVMELNPAFDIDGRTARIAALLVVSFLAGFEERGS